MRLKIWNEQEKTDDYIRLFEQNGEIFLGIINAEGNLKTAGRMLVIDPHKRTIGRCEGFMGYGFKVDVDDRIVIDG